MEPVTKETFEEWKSCTKCGLEKTTSEFPLNLTSRGGVHSQCRKCLALKKNLWVAANLEKARKTNRATEYRLNYGITIEEYDEMYEEQGGCCDICGNHQSTFSRRLSVDHNHNTGQVRALLCAGCNQGLGHYEKKKKLFEEYLQRRDSGADNP